MPQSLLAIESIELESTLRPLGGNGAPSSSDYNSGQSEILCDLASIAELINISVLPLLNAVLATASTADATSGLTIGLQGRTVVSDTSDQTALFYDSNNAAPLCLADSLRVLYGMLSTMQTTVNDLGVRVANLSTSLATTGQTDAQQAISGIYGTLSTIEAQVASLQTIQGNATAAVGNIQSQIVQTAQTFPQSTSTVTVTWLTPFPNNNYVPSFSMQDDSGMLRVTDYSYVGSGAGILIRVYNDDSTNTQQGYVGVTARTVS